MNTSVYDTTCMNCIPMMIAGHWVHEPHCPTTQGETCPDCDGGGMVAKLYPSGHTEARCDTCKGEGRI